MRVPSDRLESLASPAFIAALALLVINDFVLKSAFHNVVTGKLSDFAGLFALTLFVATLWPRQRRLAGCALAAAFTFWKTSYADSLIESLNALLPFAVGRTVDPTDLIALSMIALAVWAAPRLEPWPLHRALRIGFAILAPIAFAATSAQPQYIVRQTVELVGPTTVVSTDEAALLQQTLDEVAERRGFRCTVCDSLDEGRIYGDRSGSSMTASLDPVARTLYLDARAAGNTRRQREEIDRLLADSREALGRSFRIGAVAETSSNDDVRGRHESVTVELREYPLQTTVVEAARRTVSTVVERIAVERGLRVDENTYYLGRRLGPSEWERQLVLYVSYISHSKIMVVVRHEGDAEDALADTLLTELETRLREAFPTDLVTRARP